MLVLAIGLELLLLGFLYLISRFYEAKFGKRTYYRVYTLPAAAYVLLLAAVALGVDPGAAGLTVNVLFLLVTLAFGVRLYRQMTGVSD